MFKIDYIDIKNKVVVAPMAGVTNHAYRTIMKEFGAGLIYTEMVSDKALVYGNEKTFKMLFIEDDEKPVAIQLFGSDVNTMVKAAKIIEKHANCDILDINMGCPVKKVTKTGAGSKLMTTPKLAEDIVRGIVNAITLPVTVKIRSGWDHHSINAVDIAKRCEKAGASAIAVHGRPKSQLYRGKADWDVIKAVKQAVSIPVIGNGDITSPEDAKAMLELTGCDAIMIGRATQGNPWIIKQTVSYLSNNNYVKNITDEQKITMLLEHMDRLIELKGEKLAMLEMRTHGPWYIKGMKNATYMKREMAQINDKESFIKMIKQYKNESMLN
ncbi:MAG: tRNA dihydrouridine synthase DusB [Candidatus Izemoplasma sp.]|nr:tRNA dihydrouridine synthase DusB [Candidatus Izemoplasma sp.]